MALCAVAMSGGVDSSVAAALLQQSGYDLVGIGMNLYRENRKGGPLKSSDGEPPLESARQVARRLSIPFKEIDFASAFEQNVINYFVSSYLNGETPNPCVECNRLIKFGELMKAARELGADCLATGHYARVELDSARGHHLLMKGVDKLKDQSYFLYTLTREQLEFARFPLGAMTKDDTREVARKLDLGVHEHTESQDLCWVGPGGYRAFLEECAGVHIRPGPILNQAGEEVGTHRGLAFYTPGQRRGLGLSLPEKAWVMDIDVASNSITVALGEKPEAVDSIWLDRFNYPGADEPPHPVNVSAVTRYGRRGVPARLVPLGKNRARVDLDTPGQPVAPGQSVVCYQGDVVTGGGVAVKPTRAKQLQDPFPADPDQ